MMYAASFAWVVPPKKFATYPQNAKNLLNGAYDDSRFCVT